MPASPRSWSPRRCSPSSAIRRLGTAIRACADNYTGALVVGLDVKHLYALTFGLGAACVGAAGVMLVLIVDVTPALGPAYTLLAFVIVITGGLGSMPGALLGGVLIGLTEAMAGLLFTPSAKSMFAFAHPRAGAAVPPAGHHGQEADMIARADRTACRAARLLLLAVLLVALLARAVVRRRLSAHRAYPHSVLRLSRARPGTS